MTKNKRRLSPEQRREQVEQVANVIVDAFRDGTVPQALAKVFLTFRADVPSSRWSWRNRLIAALRGHSDARGYGQWKAVGRQVRKGEKAFRILSPCTYVAKRDDPAAGVKKGDRVVRGFRTTAVFGLSQTEGEPLEDSDLDGEHKFLAALPLNEVARAWDINLLTFRAADHGRLGFFKYSLASPDPDLIGLGVANLDVWAHELIHAADRKCGTMTLGSGQHLDNETVAQLGASVLLECLGYTTESNRGGTYRYIESYAEKHGVKPVAICTELLDRTCRCVQLILDTAAAIGAERDTAQAA